MSGWLARHQDVLILLSIWRESDFTRTQFATQSLGQINTGPGIRLHMLEGLMRGPLSEVVLVFRISGEDFPDSTVWTSNTIYETVLGIG